jgi:hypothetical protein
VFFAGFARKKNTPFPPSFIEMILNYRVTERLILRWLRIEDADFILKEWGDRVVTYYMRDEDPLKTREQAEEKCC